VPDQLTELGEQGAQGLCVDWALELLHADEQGHSHRGEGFGAVGRYAEIFDDRR
jgi:hypothetical protein